MDKIEEKDWKRLGEAINNLIQTQHDLFGWFDKEALDRTPERILNFYKELVDSNDFTFTVFSVNESEHDIIQSENDITYYSLCSHHNLPFFGKVSISYLPDKKICGISKFARVVKKFASKPGMQEHLVNEIADYLNEQLEPRFLLVRMDGRHLCKEMRGIRQTGAISKTSAIRFKSEMEGKLSHLKEEVYNQ